MLEIVQNYASLLDFVIVRVINADENYASVELGDVILNSEIIEELNKIFYVTITLTINSKIGLCLLKR